MACDQCGSTMVPGIPGDVYCPNYDCLKTSLSEAIGRTKKMREKEEMKTLASLKKKYEGDNI